MEDLAALLSGGTRNRRIVPEPIYRDLGRAIARFREARGMSQLELAQRLGKGASTIAEIETGKTRILVGDVEAIAEALGVEPRMLMQGVWF